MENQVDLSSASLDIPGTYEALSGRALSRSLGGSPFLIATAQQAAVRPQEDEFLALLRGHMLTQQLPSSWQSRISKGIRTMGLPAVTAMLAATPHPLARAASIVLSLGVGALLADEHFDARKFEYFLKKKKKNKKRAASLPSGLGSDPGVMSQAPPRRRRPSRLKKAGWRGGSTPAPPGRGGRTFAKPGSAEALQAAGAAKAAIKAKKRRRRARAIVPGAAQAGADPSLQPGGVPLPGFVPTGSPPEAFGLGEPELAEQGWETGLANEFEGPEGFSGFVEEPSSEFIPEFEEAGISPEEWAAEAWAEEGNYFSSPEPDLTEWAMDQTSLGDAICDCRYDIANAESYKGPLVAGTFFQSPLVTAKVSHGNEGFYGRISMGVLPHVITISNGIGSARAAIALTHELTHLANEMYKLGLQHHQVHELGVYFATQALPVIRAFEAQQRRSR